MKCKEWEQGERKDWGRRREHWREEFKWLGYMLAGEERVDGNIGDNSKGERKSVRLSLG